MRFHVIGLPHTETTADYVACAYTQKVVKFCQMMTSLHHEVILYGTEGNDAPCDEHVVCLTRDQQDELIGGDWLDLNRLPFDAAHPAWVMMNNQARLEIRSRLQNGDFVCIIGGLAQRSITDGLIGAFYPVEYGIGYVGTYTPYRVFESYAWMHTIYGAQQGAYAADGKFFDCVIPNSFDPADFPYREHKDDYALFVGRLIDRKGLNIAIEATRRAGIELRVGGTGQDAPQADHVTYLGHLNVEDRGKMMASAQCLLAPTMYLEPFGGVVVEAMLCGTPAITTDWGAFTETVQHGVTGYRCRTLGEFTQAISQTASLVPSKIRDYAITNYSIDHVKYQYQAYFEQLHTLQGDGWYSDWTPSTQRYGH